MSVIVVGAGPTGLLLAGDLAAAGIAVRVLEKRSLESNLTRAFALHARALEYLDARGLADELVAQGFPVDELRVALGSGQQATLSLRHPESRFPFVLMVQQARTEQLLLRRAEELGAEIVRGAEVIDVRERGEEVEAEIRGEKRMERASYLIGADGAHSVVRERLGIEFRGTPYGTRLLLADVRLREPLPAAINPFIGKDGVALLPPYGDGWFRATIWDRRARATALDEPLSVEEIADSLARISNGAVHAEEMRWSTRFLSERRHARHYRRGRIFLAGDAAHTHSPMGAMGMSVGILDAGNLSWKLVAALRGWAPAWLLDSYETERAPHARRTIAISDLILRAALAPRPLQPLRAYLLPRLLRAPAMMNRARLLVSSLGVRYTAPPGVPKVSRLGERVSDRMLAIGEGHERLYSLMNGVDFILLDGTSERFIEEIAERWRGRLLYIQTSSALEAGARVQLIRPDAYLAWESSSRDPSALRDALESALEAWLGGG